VNDLREKIAQRIEDRFYMFCKDKTIARHAACDVLDLPELKSIIEGKEKWDKYKDMSCSLLMQEEKEKALKYDEIKKHWQKEEIEIAKKKAEIESLILGWGQESLESLHKKALKYDKLFEGLQVVEECKGCERGWIASMICENCNGAGEITRDLTDEEKEEIGEWMLYAVEQHHKGLITHSFKSPILKAGIKVGVKK